MSDNGSNDRPSWLGRLGALLMREPEDREQLVQLMQSAYRRNLLDADALAMIEGVIQVSEMAVRDIMIPRSQMDVLDINAPVEELVRFAMETRHSRFPAFDGARDNVIGVLLAKDLLPFQLGMEPSLRSLLRPAVYIPESKRLNVLLKDFRSNRNHMAIVVDEYGGVAGLVTIEDVLEQIVGDIADEFDFDEAEDGIIARPDGRFRVKASMEIEDFNSSLGTAFSDQEYDTVGGLVLSHFGRMPKRGERVDFDGLRFEVLRADSRRLHWLLLERLPDEARPSPTQE